MNHRDELEDVGEMTDAYGMNTVFDGWIEEGSSGFQRDGHYYLLSPRSSGLQIVRQTIRHGCVASIGPTNPESRLIPARIVIERGHHVSVYPNLQSTQIINRAAIASKKTVYVIRDYVRCTGKDGNGKAPMDLVLGSQRLKAAPPSDDRHINVFISYCHSDEELCDRLRVGLAGLV
jgi:hypothetical protein